MIAAITLLLLAGPASAGPAVVVNEQATPMKLGAASALNAQRLADALLGEGHADVESATVGPQGMDAPLPPGPAVDTVADMRFVPTPAPTAGFCRRVVATLTMSPVSKGVTSREALYQPTSVKTRTEYRWAGRSADAKGCATPRATFFAAADDGLEQQLDVVRLVARASERARRGGRPSFAVTVDDRMGPEMIAFEAGHPDATHRATQWRVYTDGAKALAAVPASDVFAAYPTWAYYADPFTEAEVTRAKRADIALWTIRASVWTVGLQTKDGRIVAVRLVRATPAPF